MSVAAAPYRPLLVVCALGTERRALRGGSWASAPARAGILRTGMGGPAAYRAVSGALSRADTAEAALLVTGFCAALAPDITPGDVVVPDEVRDAAVPERSSPGPGAPVAGGLFGCSRADTLAEALRRRGIRVHRGAMTSADHVVRGAERAALSAMGAVAADMECAATLRAAADAGADGGAEQHQRRPVAVARVVVDTPGSELLRPATIRNGLRAYRTLRAAVPAFVDWQRALALGPPTVASAEEGVAKQC